MRGKGTLKREGGSTQGQTEAWAVQGTCEGIWGGQPLRDPQIYPCSPPGGTQASGPLNNLRLGVPLRGGGRFGEVSELLGCSGTVWGL